MVLLGFQGRLSALLRHERLETPCFVLATALPGCGCLSHGDRSLDHALRPLCGTLAGSRGFVSLSHPDPSLPCLLDILPESGVRRDRARRGQGALTSIFLGWPWKLPQLRSCSLHLLRIGANHRLVPLVHVSEPLSLQGQGHLRRIEVVPTIAPPEGL